MKVLFGSLPLYYMDLPFRYDRRTIHNKKAIKPDFPMAIFGDKM